MSRSPAAILFDSAGNPLSIQPDVAIPADTPLLLAGASDAASVARLLQVDGSGRLKTVVAPASPPAASTPISISQPEANLNVSNFANTDYVIPNGQTFYLQQLTAGAEGDPTEAGSRVDVLYLDAASAEHLITRIYVAGQTLSVAYADVSSARDGTALAGNGTTTRIRLRRIRKGGGSQEIDAEIRGYIQ